MIRSAKKRPLCPACKRRLMSDGATSCRQCFLAGRGRKKPGRHGRSILEVLAGVRAMKLKRGESVLVDGLRFTKTAQGLES